MGLELDTPIAEAFTVLVYPNNIPPGTSDYPVAAICLSIASSALYGISQIKHRDTLALAYLHGHPVHLGLALCVDGGGDGRFDVATNKHHAMGPQVTAHGIPKGMDHSLRLLHRIYDVVTLLVNRVQRYY